MTGEFICPSVELDVDVTASPARCGSYLVSNYRSFSNHRGLAAATGLLAGCVGGALAAAGSAAGL